MRRIALGPLSSPHISCLLDRGEVSHQAWPELLCKQRAGKEECYSGLWTSVLLFKVPPAARHRAIEADI